MKKYLKLFYLMGVLAGATPAYGWFGITKAPQSRYSETQIAEMRSEHNYTALVSIEQDQNPDMLLNVIRMMAETPSGEKLLNNLLDNNAVIFAHLFQESAVGTKGQTDGEQIGLNMERLISVRDTFWTLVHESEHVRHTNNVRKKGVDFVRGKYNNFVFSTMREALSERRAAQIFAEYLEQQPTDHPIRRDIGNICSENQISLSEYPDFVFRQRMTCAPIYYNHLTPHYDVYETQALMDAATDNGIRNPDWDKIISVMSDGEISELKYFPIPKNSELRADMISQQTSSMRGNILILLEKYRPESVEIFFQKADSIKIYKFLQFESKDETPDTYIDGYQYGITEMSMREVLDFTQHYAQKKLADCKTVKEKKQILSDLRLIKEYQKKVGETASYRTDCRNREQERVLSKLIDAICQSDKKKELKLLATFDANMNITGFKSPLIDRGNLTVPETADLIISELDKDISASAGNQQKLKIEKDTLQNLKDLYTMKTQSLLNILQKELTPLGNGQDIKAILSSHSDLNASRTVQNDPPLKINVSKDRNI